MTFHLAGERLRQRAESLRVELTQAPAVALERRDYPRAEQTQRALLRLEPANVPAWLRLGAALARQDRWQEAKDALDTARSIDSSAPIDPELRAYVDKMARGITPPLR